MATGLLIVVAAALVALVAWMPLATPKADAAAAMEGFFREGPPPGIWAVETLHRRQTLWIASDPEHPGCRLVGRERDGEPPEALQRRTGARVARLILGGSPDRFRKNYRLESAFEMEYTDEGRPVLRRRWLPRHDFGGDTARWMWFDARTHALVRVEDRAYGDHVIRALQRLGPLPAELPPTPESECAPQPPSPPRLPDLGAVAAQAPFAVLRPEYVPPGYELVAAGYRVWPIGEEVEGTPRRTVHMAHLYYCDGFASISLGFAPADDMDALETFVRRRRERLEEPGACPAIPENSISVPTGGGIIRRRVDRCRAVLRRDDLLGVSASLLARNEIEETEYHLMIASLVPVEPSAKPTDE